MLRLLFFLLALLALASCGCARGAAPDPVLELTGWTLVSVSGARHDVTAPARFADADLDARGHAVLEARVVVPPAWRGGPLTLTLLGAVGRASLTADGRAVPSVDVGYSQAWSLAGAAASADPDAMHLVLDLDARALPSLPAAPRLSPTGGGDLAFRRTRDLDFFGGVVAISALGLTALKRRSGRSSTSSTRSSATRWPSGPASSRTRSRGARGTSRPRSSRRATSSTAATT